MNRADILRGLIERHRIGGIPAAEIHIHPSTFEEFILEAGLQPKKTPDHRSLLQRMTGQIGPALHDYEFENVRLMKNPRIKQGLFLVRPQMLMQIEDWIERIRFPEGGSPFLESEGAAPVAAAGTPWHEKIPVQPKPEQPEDKGTLEMLQEAGGISPTDVMMKGMTGLDKVSSVIVLRFYENGDIDMSSNLNHFEIVGALQKAMMYVMSQG